MFALSVATVFNLDTAHQVIKLIRGDRETEKTRIMVGGLAFSGIPDLWLEIGADGYAADADSAVPLADEWWTNKSGNHD